MKALKMVAVALIIAGLAYLVNSNPSDQENLAENPDVTQTLAGGAR